MGIEKETLSKYRLVMSNTRRSGTKRAEPKPWYRQVVHWLGNCAVIWTRTRETDAEHSQKCSGSDADTVTPLKVMLLIITLVQRCNLEVSRNLWSVTPKDTKITVTLTKIGAKWQWVSDWTVKRWRPSSVNYSLKKLSGKSWDGRYLQDE